MPPKKSTNTENIEEAIVIDDQPQSKALTIVIDPNNKQSTTIGFALDNKEISLQTIADKIKEYEAIEINGFLDKPNYNKVKQAKSDLLKTRTTLAKVAKADVIDPINNYLSTYKANLKEVSDALQAGQDKMDQKLKDIDEAFEKHQREEEERQQARIQGRLTALTSLGAIFDPEQGIYSFSYDAGLIINSIQLKDFDDEEYNDFIATATQSYNTEQKRLEKEKADAESERQRLLTIEQGVVKARTRELTRMGATLGDDGIFIYNKHEIVPDALKTFTEDEWETLITLLENGVVVVEDKPTATEAATKETPINTIGAVVNHIAEQPLPAGAMSPSKFNAGMNPDSDSVVLPVATPVYAENVYPNIKEHTVEILFTSERPYREHQFKNTTMRIFSPIFDTVAKANVKPTDIVNQGELSDTGMHFLLIKRTK